MYTVGTSYPGVIQSPTSYRQPMPTVNCPYCTLLLEYPPDAHIIRCPMCSGTSMLQVMQQLHMPCRRCNTLLSYFPHYALLQCPQCHLQQAPPPPAAVYTAHAVTQPSPATTRPQQQRQQRLGTANQHAYPGTYAVLPPQKTSEQKPQVQSQQARTAALQPQSYQPPPQRSEPLPRPQPYTPVFTAPRLSVPDTKPRSKSFSSSHPPPPVSVASSASTAPLPDSSVVVAVSSPAKSGSSNKPAVTTPTSSSKRSRSPKLTELLAGVHISAPPPAAPSRLSLSTSERRQQSSIDLNAITPVVGDYSSFSSANDADEKRNPPLPGASITPSSTGSALSRLNPLGSHAVSDGNGRFEALAEESTVEYSRFGGEPSVYRREDGEQDDSEDVGAVEAMEPYGENPGAAFYGRQAVYSPTSLSRQPSASVYRND